MYVPRLYREEDHETIMAFLKQNNFPALVSHDGEKLTATHLPVEVVEEEQGGLTVFGHMARANRQWKSLNGQEVMLIFQGAHTYISPRWYGHVNVPTWNYMMVHVYGTIRQVEGHELYSLLSRLVGSHEKETPYRLETLPQDFVEKEIQGVFGFAVTVTRLEAAYKLSQNRDEADHANIARELEKRGDENSIAVAKSMRTQRKRSSS